MFMDYVLDLSSADYENKILIIDDSGLDDIAHYSEGFAARGFDIIHYKDDLSFRTQYEDLLKADNDKVLIIADSQSYIPYDVYQRLRAYELSMNRLFPKLNANVLREQTDLDLDLLSTAYKNTFEDYSNSQRTKAYLREKVYNRYNVSICLESLYSAMMSNVSSAQNYSDWIKIAEEKAHIDVLAAQYDIEKDTSEVNRVFKNFVMSDFGKLSSQMNRETPILVSRAMEFMHDESSKFIIIVMDGMSEFDWEILSKSFSKIPYRRTGMFAMIPSTTSISRQCLLAGKYPGELLEPWKQSKEKQEFITCAKNLGYSDKQIAYERGYDSSFDSLVRCGAVIINDIDNMVHAQRQGRRGMADDDALLESREELLHMTERFLQDGFDVYITADHGNTPCVGMGKLVGTGVEMETKSHRMLVLQNYADKEALIAKYGMIDYPKYYLNKNLDYLICDVGESLDAKGEKVMTHGGISLDEVVVPFIRIKAVDYNG